MPDLYDVVVVGLGPVGITQVNLLAQRGLRVFGVDAAEEIYPLPRASAFDHETMRVFQSLGLADTLAGMTAVYHDTEYLSEDGAVLQRMISPPQPWPLGWPPYVTFVQPPLEAALRALAAGWSGVDLRYGVSVTQVSQDTDAARLALSDGTLVSGRYAVACDGAASFTRKQLGIGMEDLNFRQPWLVVDMILEGEAADLPVSNQQLCHPARPATHVILPGNLRRWEFRLMPGENPEEMRQDDSVWRLLAPWLKPSQARIWRAATYNFNARLAERFRAGRVLLAGDAAHQMPPFLAQGMVQGIKDAVNLTWKLQAALEGAPDAILDSYEAERRPHVLEVIRTSKSLGETIGQTDAGIAAGRNIQLLARMAEGKGIHLRQSLFPPLAGGVFHESPGAGRQVPQPEIRRDDGTTVLMDALLPDDFVLLAGRGFPIGAQGSRRLDALGVPVVTVGPEVCTLSERNGVFTAFLDEHAITAVIVRPDRMVFAGLPRPDDLPAALDALQRHLHGEAQP